MNQQDKETLIYIVAAVLLVFVGLNFVKPEFVKYQRNNKQLTQLKPQIEALRVKVSKNRAELRKKQSEELGKTKPGKKQFVISKLSDAQDNTSIILDEIFMIAKKNKIQLLEIDHSGNDSEPLEDPNEDINNKDYDSRQKALAIANKSAKNLTTNLGQKEIEYYRIKFLFSSDYQSMKKFMKELINVEHYIRVDSIDSSIQKGRRDIINTELNLSILLKKHN